MGKRLLYILAFADIQKIHVDVDMITKQLIWEVGRVTKRLTGKNPCELLADGCRWRGSCGKRQAWIEECLNKLEKYEVAEEEERYDLLGWNLTKNYLRPNVVQDGHYSPVLVTTVFGKVEVAFYNTGKHKWYILSYHKKEIGGTWEYDWCDEKDIVAWRAFPKPYQDHDENVCQEKMLRNEFTRELD